MNKMVKSKKPNFKEIYPHMWNQYIFLYQERRRFEHRFEFVLALNTLLLIIFLQLFSDNILDGLSLFYIPFVIFIIPIVLLFYHIIPRTIMIPWFEKEQIKDIFDKNKDFYEEITRNIYGTLGHISAYASSKKRILNISLFSLLTASFSTMMVVMYDIKQYCFVGMVFVLFVLVVVLIGLKMNKEYIKGNPSSQVENFFDNWLKD